VRTFRRATSTVKASTVAAAEAASPVPAGSGAARKTEGTKEPTPTTTLDGMTSGTGYDFV
jgi:hypothetical protein